MKTLARIGSTILLPLFLTAISSPASAQLGAIANDLVFTPITPCRIIDTRYIPSLPGNPIPAGGMFSFQVTTVGNYAVQGGSATNCGGAGADGNYAAALINFTVVSPETGGYITAFPAGITLANRPLAATVNFEAGSVRGNSAVIKLRQTGDIDDMNVFSSTTTHLVADLLGYYATPKTTAVECTNVLSAGVDLLPGAAQAIYSPQCTAGYTITSGGCFRTQGTTGGYHNTYAFNTTGSAHPTNPNTFYCGMQNTHPTETSNVTASARCCRIPGR